MNQVQVRAARIGSIDAMRGLVMMIMTIDHVRETFFLHRQVSDPMDVGQIEPALFFTRLAAHFCAPMFVFLTGLSAWLYANPAGGNRNATGFLLKRGLFLVALELFVVNLLWSGSLPPAILYLQVIWVIGLAMIALALLHRLPLPLLALIGVLIVGGHNALTGPEHGSALWTLLEQRGFLVSDGPMRIKISYPLLPWIGIILLGFAAGPLFGVGFHAARRQQVLIGIGLAGLLILIVLRGLNLYGEALPWVTGPDALRTAMSMLNLTKYPPSLLFTLLTLGVGLMVLALFDRFDGRSRLAAICQVYGGAPLFYYLLHLLALLLLGRAASALFGVPRLDVQHVWQVWLITVVLVPALYLPCRWYGERKRRSGAAWMRYL